MKRIFFFFNMKKISKKSCKFCFFFLQKTKKKMPKQKKSQKIKLFTKPEIVFQNEDKKSWLNSCSINADVADILLEHCQGLPLDMFPTLSQSSQNGKQCQSKRHFSLFSDKENGFYTISKTIIKAKPLSAILKRLITKINHHFNEVYNSVVVNYYPDGMSYIGPHTDGKKNLGKHGVITISLGATREFVIYEGFPAQKIYSLGVVHGQLVQMSGQFQDNYAHGVPIDENCCNERFSLTFRAI